jgi:hypothetical protein
VLADALTGRAGIFDGELVMLGSDLSDHLMESSRRS